MMTYHVLKTLSDYWDAVERGDKMFEVRRDDRGFQKGDVLVLLRMEPPSECTTSPQQKLANAPKVRCEITYILTGGQFGIKPGYVVLGLTKVAPEGT